MVTTYSVQFVGYVIQDEFTEYHMKVTSSDNVSWLVRRRYREFRELHDHLKLKYPDRIPSVPGKKLWGNQDPEFVRQRQDQLQSYMNSVLSLEADCRTRVLQRFLEIKRPSGGSPVVEHSPSSNQQPATSYPVTPAMSAVAAVSSVQSADKQAALNQVIADLQKDIFDLSVTPSLLDAGEYASRQKKYSSIIASAQAPATASAARVHSPGPFEAVAWTPGSGVPEPAKSALSAILGKAPLASEHELVAFFSLKPVAVATSPIPASSSSPVAV